MSWAASRSGRAGSHWSSRRAGGSRRPTLAREWIILARRACKPSMTPQLRFAWVLPLVIAAGCAPAKAPAPIHATAPMVALVDPHLVEMTAEPTTTLVLASASTELGIRVKITAHDLPAAQRPPLNLALVLDTSGSMEGQ